MKPSNHRHEMTWVIKLTKLCNLRCRYCYEYKDLDNPARMDLDNIRNLLITVRDICKNQDSDPHLCWHGGEPLIIPLKYWEGVFAIIDDVFTDCSVKISVQSNLYSPRWDVVELFKAKGVKIGVSFDVANSDRVQKNGSGTEDRVLQNLDRIIDDPVYGGGIAVLSKKNINQVGSVFQFYNGIGASVRILPFYRKSYDDQKDVFGLSQSEIFNALESVLNMWWQNGSGIIIEPLWQSMRAAIRYSKGEQSNNIFIKQLRENCLVVDTNFETYAVGTTYLEEYSYGNIIEDSATKIMDSDGRRKAISRAEDRMSICETCQFWGLCSGYALAESTDIEMPLSPTTLNDCMQHRLISSCLNLLGEKTCSLDIPSPTLA